MCVEYKTDGEKCRWFNDAKWYGENPKNCGNVGKKKLACNAWVACTDDDLAELKGCLFPNEGSPKCYTGPQKQDRQGESW